MAELLGRVERLATNTPSQQQINGQPQVIIKKRCVILGNQFLKIQAIPSDIARIQDINRVINSNTDMTRTIQSFAYVG